MLFNQPRNRVTIPYPPKTSSENVPDHNAPDTFMCYR